MRIISALILLLIVAVGPSLFWLRYFYLKDKYEPEPLSWIVKIFLLGALLTIPVVFIEFLSSIFLSEFVIAVIVAPITEECGKFFIVYRSVYQSREFSEPVDGIIYAVTGALGFAMVENIFYIFAIPLIELAELFWAVFLRAVLSVPGHALFSSISGYSLGIAKFGNPQNAQKIILAGLAGAIIFHALFNYLLMDFVWFAFLVLMVIPFLWWFIHRNIREAIGKSGFH